MKMFKGMAVALVVSGMIVPGQMAMAGAPKTAAKAAAPAISDVTLTAGGTLSGQVVDAQGRGVDGATVSVRQGGREIAKTVANKDGKFAVTKLRSGTHEVVAGNSQGAYRFWTAQTAPPAAKQQVLLVSGAQQVTRGQPGLGLDAITLATLGAAGTAAIISGINNGDINDLQDDASALQAQNAALQDQVNDLQDSVDQLLMSP